MKTYSLTVILCTLSVFLLAQAPQQFNYQGIARDLNGSPLANQSIGILIELKSGNAGGAVIFSEAHSDTTNSFGLFNIKIGTGNPLNGDLSSINWGANQYFLSVGIDASGGTNYLALGTTQLLSVPYALYAETAGSSDADGDSSSSNELNESAQLNGNTLSISDPGGAIEVDLTNLVNDTDADPSNELQTLGINSAELSISNGNSVDLSNLIDDADADVTNELQELEFDNQELSISDGNTVDLSPINTTGFDFAEIEFDDNPGLMGNIPTTVTSITSISLTVPTAGYIVLQLTGTAVFFGDNTNMEFGLSTNTTGYTLCSQLTGRLDGSGTERYRSNFSVDCVVPINSAGTYTYRANVSKSTVFDTNQINLSSLTVIGTFYENRY